MSLDEWLTQNHISYDWVGRDILNIPEFGQCLVQDLEANDEGLFLINDEGEVRFNCIDSIKGLLDDGTNYVIVNFGENYYYIDLQKDFKLEILKYVGKYNGHKDKYEFCNIGCHDAYELLNGSFLPKDWVRKAKWVGHRALGVSNLNTMASLYNLQKECNGAGITPVFGYDFVCRTSADVMFNAKVYVQSEDGLRNMLKIQRAIMVDNVENKEIPYKDLLKLGNGLILVLGKLSPLTLDFNYTEFEDYFDKVYYQLDPTEYKAERIDVMTLEAIKKWYENYRLYPPILIPDAYYLDQDDAKNKIILNKIACGAAHDQSDQQYYRMLSDISPVLEDLFSDKEICDEILKKACENVMKVVDGSKARFENTRNFMPKYDMTEEEKAKYGTTHNMFNVLLEEGLNRLAPPDRYEEYKKRMELEKYVIESTDNIDYLLVQYDSTNWCRRNGIYVGCGRGSAAGCLLLYLLGITLVDPLKYNLLFERFLLPERAGLYSATTSIISDQLESTNYIELSLENNRTILFDIDAKFLVDRSGKQIEVYADELEEGDDIIFDNRDRLFSVNEI